MKRVVLSSLVSVVACASTAHAVLIFGGTVASPTAMRQFVNDVPITPPPAGTGANLVGNFGGFSGMPISSTHFITAKHFGVAGTITVNGNTYNTGSFVDDPSSDLRIVSITGGTFSSWASLYTGSDEVSKAAYVFGRGRGAGSLVTVSGNNKGWRVSDGPALDGKLSWAATTVDFAAGGGTLLGFDFNPGVGESTLTEGDSGGGMFVQEAGIWKLAAVHFGITSPFSQNSDGSSAFLATIFDASGLYYNIGTNAVPNWQPVTGPGASFSTRISDKISWINTVIPEPTSLAMLGLGCITTLRRRR